MSNVFAYDEGVIRALEERVRLARGDLREAQKAFDEARNNLRNAIAQNRKAKRARPLCLRISKQCA